VFKYLEAYSLADYYPAVFAELQMLGFPADNVQNGKPTMSEQCTVKPPESLDIDGKNDPTNYDIQIKPKIGKHNCDVYGGNSGGPIRIRGTHDVIALPASYIPENYQKGSMLASAFMELTKGFIDRNRKSLIAAGVSLSKEPIRSGGNYQYLQKLVKNRNFVSEERPSYRIRISKIDWALGTVEVSFSNNGGQSFNPAVKFVCEDANSHSRNCYHQGNNQTQYGATWYMDLWRDDKILLHFRKGNSMAQDFLTPTQR
jgi:hypothetical protein